MMSVTEQLSLCILGWLKRFQVSSLKEQADCSLTALKGLRSLSESGSSSNSYPVRNPRDASESQSDITTAGKLELKCNRTKSRRDYRF